MLVQINVGNYATNAQGVIIKSEAVTTRWHGTLLHRAAEWHEAEDTGKPDEPREETSVYTYEDRYVVVTEQIRPYPNLGVIWHRVALRVLTEADLQEHRALIPHLQAAGLVAAYTPEEAQLIY